MTDFGIIPGAQASKREQTWGEAALHLLGKPEEVIVKALQLKNPLTGSNYHTQESFTTLLRDNGADPLVAALVGTAASILNPIDPLNKLKLFGLTKTGKVAEQIRGAESFLKAGKDGVKLLDKTSLLDKIADLKKARAASTNVQVIEAIDKSIASLTPKIKDLDSVNEVLAAVQRGGTKLEDIKLGDNLVDQIKRGQRRLVGFTAPSSMEHLSLFGLGRGFLDDATVMGALPRTVEAKLAQGLTGVKDFTSQTVGAAASKVLKTIGAMPATEAAAKARSAIEAAAKHSAGSLYEKEAMFTNVIEQFQKDGIDISKLDDVLQEVEWPTFAEKQVFIKTLENYTKGDSLLESRLVGSKSISNSQKDLITPGGVSEEDIFTAVTAYGDSTSPVMLVGKSGRHAAKLLGEHVVMHVSGSKAIAGPLDELDGVFKQRQWVRHTDDSGRVFLVSKRLPFSKPLTKSSDLSTEHLRNLEVIAAQLGRKKKMLVGLHPSDILVSPNGGIQIINPDVIQDAKQVSEAIAGSDVTITRLAESLGVAPIDFHSLKSVSAAKSVPTGTDAFTYRSSADIGGSYQSTNELLMGAGNNSLHQMYIRASYGDQEAIKHLDSLGDFEYLNGIEKLRAEYRAAMADGKSPYIEPIEVFRDDRGTLQIRDGRERLTAAALEGIEAVPIKEIKFYGDSIISDDAFVGSGQRLRHAWAGSGAPTSGGLGEGVINQTYKLVGADGQVFQLSADMLGIHKQLSSTLGKLLTIGPHMAATKAAATRLDSVAALLTNKFGSVEVGLLAVADIAESSTTAKDFVTKLKPLLTDKDGRSIALDNILIHPQQEVFFRKVKNAATQSLDESATKGILTNAGIQNPKRVGLASKTGGFIVQDYDAATNTIRFRGASATTADLKKSANGFFEHAGGAREIEPLASVELSGADGVQKLTVRDFVTGEHPLHRVITKDIKQFKIADSLAKKLQHQGVFIYTGKNKEAFIESLKDRGLNHGVLLSSSKTKVFRPDFAFFVTASGDVVVGTQHNNVLDLFKAVFKEAPPIYQEFGVITTGRIVVSNPLGGVIERIGIRELNTVKNRLVELSNRFKEMGFSESTVLKVHTPLDDPIWRAMYGERVTIHDVLDPNFKLKIPEDLLGHAPDSSIDAPSRYLDVNTTGIKGVVAIERTRLANGKLQQLVDFIRDTGDKAFLDEAKASLPVTYYESYFGRSITKQAREALQEAYIKYPNKESKTFKHLEGFMKGRVVTDLTTLEFNEIVKRLQKENVTDVDEVISDVVKQYRKGYEMTPSTETAVALNALAKLLPTGLDFFHVNPIYATSLRAAKSIKAITREELVQSLKDLNVVVWSGSLKEMRKASVTHNEKVFTIEKQIDDLENSITEMRTKREFLSTKAGNIDQAGIDKLTSDLDTAINKIAKLRNEKLNYLDKLKTSNTSQLLVDLSSEEAWISSDTALNLIQKGTLKADDVVGTMSDALVKVDIKKYASALDEETEVFLFPPDVAKEVERYFGVTKRDGFNKFLSFWDEMHATWRAWTLFPIPAYHIRNGVSSAFMGWLGGITDPAVYRASFKINSLMTSYRKGVLNAEDVRLALKSMVFSNPLGQTTTGEELWQQFVHLGGVHGGLNRNEFGRFGNVRRASDFEREAAKAGIAPSSEFTGSWLMDNSLLRRGVSAASWIENRFRLAAFIHAWQKGETLKMGKEVLTGFDAAMMFVKKVYYDYSDLSAFERSWLTRVIPFYAWSRHNIPRMLTTLITDPIKHYRLHQFVTDLETGVVGGPVDPNSLPEWVRERYGVIIGRDSDGKYIVKTAEGFLPIADVFKILSGRGIIGALEDGLTPFIKVPIEQMANYSLYTQQNIEQYAGQRARSFTLGEFGFSRRATNQGPLGVLNLVLNESLFKSLFRLGGDITTKIIDPLFDPTQTEGVPDKVLSSVMNLAIGRAYSIDPDKTLNAVYRNWNRNKSTLNTMRKNAVSRGAASEVQDIDAKLNWLMLQYPGKEK